MSQSLTFARNSRHAPARVVGPLINPEDSAVKLGMKVDDAGVRRLGVPHDGEETPFALLPRDGSWERFELPYVRSTEEPHGGVIADEYERLVTLSEHGLDANALRTLGVAYGLDVKGERDGEIAHTTIWLQEHDDNYLPETPPRVPIELRASHRVWSSTYWPMSGPLPGNPSSNLWATGGPLDKFDEYLRRLGQDSGALEFERQPNLNRFFGRGASGYWIPAHTLSERDAERTTGVDINGNGVLDEAYEHDFLTAAGHFGRDGRTDGTMGVGWWGSCDKVALAGCLFAEPRHAVTLEGVTFTAQDIKGLLAVIAESQGGRIEFAGNRYDRHPDRVTLGSGEVVQGVIQNMDLADFRSGDFHRVDDYGRRGSGDNIVRSGAPRDIEVRLADGTTRGIPASEVRSVQRECKRDIDPGLFHETAIRWLQDGRPFAMDHDPGDHVWNDNYDGARFTPITRDLSEAQLRSLNGTHGNYGGGDLECWEAKLLKGDFMSKRYSYWLERRDGEVVNSGWLEHDNPDFMWRPSQPASFAGRNARNPFVKPELVKALYEASIT